MSDSYILLDEPFPAPAGKRKVLVTGAAGMIGRHFAESVCEKYDLTLLVHSERNVPKVEAFGRAVVGGIEDAVMMAELCRGIDTVVHLGANASPRASWEVLLPINIIGTYNVFEGARAAGCRRVVFASSIHAVFGYPAGRQVRPADPVSPGDIYGVTKCFGEALGRYMATGHGMSAIAIRIAGCRPEITSGKVNASWLENGFISMRDMCQLLERCVDDERLLFAILNGVSATPRDRLSLDETRERVGYEPQDALEWE